MEPEQLKSSFQHLRFRKHDVVVFHLLERNELAFEFDRPIRFVDLEGAPPMLVDPTIIARQYRDAVSVWQESLRILFRDTSVDYHKVNIDEHFGEVLVRFLLARKRGNK
jgi:hypothetical protein